MRKYKVFIFCILFLFNLLFCFLKLITLFYNVGVTFFLAEKYFDKGSINIYYEYGIIVVLLISILCNKVKFWSAGVCISFFIFGSNSTIKQIFEFFQSFHVSFYILFYFIYCDLLFKKESLEIDTKYKAEFFMLGYVTIIVLIWLYFPSGESIVVVSIIFYYASALIVLKEKWKELFFINC